MAPGAPSASKRLKLPATPPAPDNGSSTRSVPLSTAPSPPSAPVNLRQLCARFAQPHLGKAVWQLINTLPLFAAIWALMAWSIHAQWNYLLDPAAGRCRRPVCTCALFIIQHDCGHGSYFASAKRQQHRRRRAGPDHAVPVRLLEEDPRHAPRHLGQPRPPRDGRHRNPHRRRVPGAVGLRALLLPLLPQHAGAAGHRPGRTSSSSSTASRSTCRSRGRRNGPACWSTT